MKKLSLTFISCLSFFLVSVSAQALPRYFQSHLTSQIAQLTKSAAAGSAENQNALGLLYLTGPTPNYTKGLYWLNKSAKQGNSKAQYNLGLIYKKGYGSIKADYSKSKYWLTRSSNNGYKLAQSSLASLNQLGSNLAGNLSEKSDRAVNWVENKLDPYRIDSQ